MAETACVALLIILWAGTALAASSPFDVGTRAQLFVDQVLVHSTQNVAFTLHPAVKHPDNPLIVSDRPEDGWRLALCGSTIYDEEEGLYKMWYLGGNGTLHATSHDGIAWSKHEAFWESYMFASVIKDGEASEPSTRYKIIAWSPNTPGVLTPGYERPVRSGYNTSVSPDGRQIARISEQPICPYGDVITGYYDRQRQRYVAFPKTMTVTRGFNRRCFSVITSEDFLHWSEPRLVLVPDLRDDAGSLARLEEARPLLDVPDDSAHMRTEFYGLGVYQHESCVLAFPWMLTINNRGRYGNHEGPGEIQLAVSRDLEHWERPFRTPCVPRGDPGDWDSGFFWTPNEAIRVGNEIWLYYAASNYTHGAPVTYSRAPDKCHRERLVKYTASIGLAVWELDRFVSVDGPDEGGTLTTVPLRSAGTRLELNARTRSGGSITVEVLDPTGRVLARSGPVVGDDLCHRVQWPDGTNLVDLAERPVCLRLHIRRAELYSFAFRD